jgi:hypothetical protein
MGSQRKPEISKAIHEPNIIYVVAYTTQPELIASLNNTMSEEKHTKVVAELFRLARASKRWHG